MLKFNHSADNVAKPASQQGAALEILLAFKLKISLLLNFYSYLVDNLPPFITFFHELKPHVTKLQAWLAYPEHYQVRDLETAEPEYRALIKLFQIYDDKKPHKESSIFSLAAFKGFHQIVQDMLEEGAETETEGLIALNLAIEAGHEEVTRVLVKGGVPIDLLNSKSFRHVTVVRVLMETKVLLPQNCSQILMDAVRDGNLLLVEFLIYEGVKVNILDSEGKTLLNLAAEQGSQHIVHALIKAGAKIDARDPKGRTPLVCASAGNHVGVVRELLQHPLQRQDLPEAIRQAANNPGIKVMHSLIQAGGNPNYADESGRTLLYRAAENQDADLVKALLDLGADPNRSNQGGFTPLMEAATQGNWRMTKLLLDAGAELNTKNKYGSTAVFWAAEKGNFEMVKSLILAGADLTVINREGDNPRTWAEKHGQERVAQLIHQGMLRQLYLNLKHRCPMNEVRQLIETQRTHRISKEDLVSYLLRIRAEPKEKLALLEEAIACDARGVPSNSLSSFMHITQGCGFKRFFTREPSYAVARIKAAISSLRLSSPRALPN